MLKLRFAVGAALAAFTALPSQAITNKCTTASYYGYGDGFHGQTTANGERLNGHGLSTAHRSLPFGTRLRVHNPDNGKSVIVRVNDRGPFVAGRDLDLSYGAFSRLAKPSSGITKVCYSRI